MALGTDALGSDRLETGHSAEREGVAVHTTDRNRIEACRGHAKAVGYQAAYADAEADPWEAWSWQPRVAGLSLPSHGAKASRTRA
jgi:hypothetical protein